MLELRNVSFTVSEENSGATKEIIKNVSLTIGDNEFVAITGPNGGGKSTMARLIMGIEKPTSGSILYNGEDITDLSITERAKKGLGFAFQMPVRFKGITVKDLLVLASGTKLTTAEAIAAVYAPNATTAKNLRMPEGAMPFTRADRADS